jgi:hypothetical protein
MKEPQVPEPRKTNKLIDWLVISILIVICLFALRFLIGSGIQQATNIKEYIISVVQNKPIQEPSLPSGVVESSQIAQFCADSLEEQRPSTWSIEELRFCVDRLNGYTDVSGAIVHPFAQ